MTRPATEIGWRRLPQKHWNAEDEVPVVNWWRHLQGDQATNQIAERDLKLIPGDPLLFDPAIDFKSFGVRTAETYSNGSRFPRGRPPDSLVSKWLLNGSIPVPSHARPETTEGKSLEEVTTNLEEPINWLPPTDVYDGRYPSANAVMTGVIDTGIALYHRRLRDENGDSRILAAWLQTSQHMSRDAAPAYDQNYLPFGRELYAKDIDEIAAMAYDEEDFNRRAGATEIPLAIGHRELERTAAHGAHVMDIAAGFDPTQAGKSGAPSTLADAPIIAVTLPKREVVGLSGTFLEYFVVYGLFRIIALSDHIWATSGHKLKDPDGKCRTGYPIVINLSFGKQAGPKDLTNRVTSLLEEINIARKKESKRPVYLSLPAGNDNLLRGAAQQQVPAAPLGPIWPGKQRAFEVRLQPEDYSSSYLTVWSDWIEGPPLYGCAAPLDITLVPPPFKPLERQIATPVRMRHGRAIRLTKLINRRPADVGSTTDDMARIYCEFQRQDGRHRVLFNICIAPTISNDKERPVAPPGLWRLVLRSRRIRPLMVFASVQTDQSANPSATTGLRPYFEAQDYSEFDAVGRLYDVSTYPGNVPTDLSSTVRRRGTINAMSEGDFLAVLGSYRGRDGKPSLHSSAAGDQERYAGAIEQPTASAVDDDGYAHFGILGAGAKDGSVVAMRGTSFAAAQATRQIAAYLRSHPGEDAILGLKQKAAADESQRRNKGAPAPVKTGHGRLEPDLGRPAAKARIPPI